MTLDRYKKSITNMTDEELKIHLADIRKKRRTPAKPEARRKAAGIRKPPDKTKSLAKALQGLSPEDLSALRAVLKGNDDEAN